MQIKLELSTPLLKLIVLTLVLVCEYLKYSRLCPWLFKWPEYEEEQQYEDDGQQDVYNN
jgi:hypothetical protein